MFRKHLIVTPKRNLLVSTIKRFILFVFLFSFLFNLTSAPHPTLDQKQRRLSVKNLSQISSVSTQSLTDESNSDKININTANEKVLSTLPGIGKVLAKRIIIHRKQFPFKKKEDVKLIRGIGKKRFAGIKELICVM